MIAICKDCGKEYSAFDGGMVIVNDKLWANIADEKSDCICDVCMEKRLGRPITEEDFKPSTQGPIIPVNSIWLTKRKSENAKRVLNALMKNISNGCWVPTK